MNAKLKTDALDLTSLLNGLVFFSPVSLLVRTTAGISLSQFFILQAIMATMVLLTEIPLGKLTDRIGYKSTLVLYQIALLISRTCLLLAHVSCNYSLFILQAILEGTAASFSSGTQSGYIYIMFSKEHYAEKSAHVANYGTVGFFASTLAYAVLYTLIGIKGLLLATIAANLVAVFTSLKIPKETVQPRSETRQKKNIPYPQLFQQKKIWMLLMILAALNIGRILINFFYAEKLQLCGINETWLAAIIMGYSAIQLLSERILARTKPEHYKVCHETQLCDDGTVFHSEWNSPWCVGLGQCAGLDYPIYADPSAFFGYSILSAGRSPKQHCRCCRQGRQSRRAAFRLQHGRQCY